MTEHVRSDKHSQARMAGLCLSDSASGAGLPDCFPSRFHRGHQWSQEFAHSATFSRVTGSMHGEDRVRQHKWHPNCLVTPMVYISKI